jgi:prepilin-type N-terminal cleavage/methylation domain-containing protein
MKYSYEKSGFTLIELIIYMAIASVVLVTAVGTGMNVITTQGVSETKREIYTNARFLMNQFGFAVRNADDVIIGSSTFGSNPGILTLDYPGIGTNVIFDTYTKNIIAGGQAVTIRKLEVKDGTADYVDLTSDSVTVTNFTLMNLTRGAEPKNINIQLTLESVNPGNNKTYDISIPLETALSIRR